MIGSVTALVLTYNEAPNIGRTLEKLSWTKEIVVVDSFSTDETLDIVKKCPQARIIQRNFDDHTSQWNFGLDNVRTDWVLSLDADYVLTDELVEEIQLSKSENGTAAYFARFIYCLSGRRLRGTLYPPRAVLFRRELCRYEPDGHTQLLKISGKTDSLSAPILHDDRKPLDRWLQEQSRYARIEAEHLLKTSAAQLNLADRLRRKIVIAPFLVFFYTLIFKGLILDGWPGFHYVLQRTVAEVLLSLKLIEEKLKK